MTKKTRLIILLICAALFFIITPYIVLYSLGYRIDFEKRKIVATGGIYVKALPSSAEVIIDSKIKTKTGILSNSAFVQNLSAKTHSVAIKKEGYYDYQKNLAVKENEVTKLEHVILIKQNNTFKLLDNNVDYFSLSPNENNLLLAAISDKKVDFKIINLKTQQAQNLSLLAGINLPTTAPQVLDLQWSGDSSRALINISGSYFLIKLILPKFSITVIPLLTNAKEISFNPQDNQEIFFVKDKNLYSSKKSLPVLKNVIVYQLANQTITWFSYDGFMYASNVAGNLQSKINLQPLNIKKNGAYKIKIISGIVFLQEDELLLWVNPSLKIVESFYSSVKDFKISPDGQKILYCNDHEILFSSIPSTTAEKMLLNRFSEKISNCYWLNNEYLIFNLGDKVAISETDTRGNINTVVLPEKLSLGDDKTIEIERNNTNNPLKIYFSQADKQLYLLTKKNMLASERLIP
ncbi:MAG: hypothetical protein A3A98_01660 [Candidatus Staskawiczbacteria bacterium RIFCSPLOWO2_01_FULL_40_39]|uniref:PEGA domain-containing protein n=1 Tax=Candidatus Staskawiczbacteria bacterium RIFCSPHIGHO2_01_FULL_39_25 TaxID=1802202 RepID=A0A1G2HQ65_9BACT|nr:MAG: hypothetical protein A2730_01815 [Candidatus Staskawiczbacteria bacterium RIFCSPHIGHO2_01_FULL_39_25]OGZ72680.1 MAG: hypothetical protein A3A98_01660 [Candidatus Staskawiczbacteria bacterium RIFCSPLOWO2_01_FULL_40_39]OGZ74363.1 MAG: hypothetical protein A3I87_01080 [Candidatus Staskawiczbacteria bacterium RIFCSPLOWO2_02_FULL_39_8]